MKIYADENIEHSIIDGLRRRKIEVICAKELGPEPHINFLTSRLHM